MPKLRFMGSEIIGGSHSAPSFRKIFTGRGPMYNKPSDSKDWLADKGGSTPTGEKKPEKRELTDAEREALLSRMLGTIQAARTDRMATTENNAQPRQEKPPEPVGGQVLQAQTSELSTRIRNLEQKSNEVPVATDYGEIIAALKQKVAALETAAKEIPKDLQQTLAGLRRELGSLTRILGRKADETKISTVETRLGALEAAGREIPKDLQQTLAGIRKELDELTGAVSGIDPQKIIDFRQDMVLFEGRITDAVLAKIRGELIAKDEEIELLKNRIAGLEIGKNSEDTQVRDQITSMQAEIEQLKTRCNKLEAENTRLREGITAHRARSAEAGTSSTAPDQDGVVVLPFPPK